MVNIAIVEDERAASNLLREHLTRFSEEKGVQFSVRIFENAVIFLTNYHADFQVIFMDIEMPHLNGMEAAKKLREIDPTVVLVFITNMAQYAIKGYEVDALDFVLKPVSYYRFSSLLQKILRQMEKRRDVVLTIRTPGSVRRLSASSVAYISVEDHLLLYHTEDGVIESWGSLKSVLENLAPHGFIQINKSSVVNLRHVRSVSGDTMLVGDTAKFTLSRGRKAEVLAALNRFLER